MNWPTFSYFGVNRLLIVVGTTLCEHLEFRFAAEYGLGHTMYSVRGLEYGVRSSYDVILCDNNEQPIHSSNIEWFDIRV
jgi:hypothetical protein